MEEQKGNIDAILRPRTIKDLFTSKNVETVIKNMADKGKINHSFFLIGTTGNGKTTTSRALARYLFTGTDDQDYDLENSMCFIEIDGPNLKGVEEVRELIKSVGNPGLVEEKVIVVVDEAHDISPKAESAFLKILEEPPEHLYFIICTNHPDKMKAEFKNRCQTIVFNTPTEGQLRRYISDFVLPKILDYLDDATKQSCLKNIEALNDERSTKIINATDRSYRSTIKKVYEFILTGEIVAEEEADEVKLGSVMNLMLNPSPSNWRGTVQDIINSTRSFETLRGTLCNYINKVYMNKLDSLKLQPQGVCEDEKMLNILSIMKDELAYASQKADFTQRLVRIILMNIGAIQSNNKISIPG
jgi:DNA polymerase III gamma/tau subunit